MNHATQLRRRRYRTDLFPDDDGDESPTSGLTNAFDAAIVFALAFMVALVQHLHVPSMLQAKDYTVITNPGKSDMEIIVKEGQEIKHYEATQETGVGRGELLGKAYRLPDGRVVYVPADKEPGAAADPRGGE